MSYSSRSRPILSPSSPAKRWLSRRAQPITRDDKYATDEGALETFESIDFMGTFSLEITRKESEALKRKEAIGEQENHRLGGIKSIALRIRISY